MIEKVFESDPKLKNLFEASEATKLLEKRRVLAETDEMYAQCYRKYKEDMRNFLEQEERFKETDLLMQERFVKANKAILDNQFKKKRADQHIREEKKLQAEKLSEIEAERAQLARLEEQRRELDAAIRRLRPLEEYLRDAAGAAPEAFSGVTDLMQRFASLQQANARLRGHERENQAQLTRASLALNSLEKERSTAILLLRNKQSELQKQFEMLEAKNAHARSGAESREQAAAEKSRVFAKIILAVDNIHEMAVQLNSIVFCKRASAGRTDKRSAHQPTASAESNDIRLIYLKKIAEIQGALVSANKMKEFSKKFSQSSKSA